MPSNPSSQSVEQLTLGITGEQPDPDAETLAAQGPIVHPGILHIRKMELAIDVLNGFDEEADLRRDIARESSQAGRVGNLEEQKAHDAKAGALRQKLDLSMEDTKEIFANMIGVEVVRDEKGKVKPVDEGDAMKLDSRYTSQRIAFAGRKTRIVGVASEQHYVEPYEYREYMRGVYRDTILKRRRDIQAATVTSGKTE